jgi:hypothetical protein
VLLKLALIPASILIASLASRRFGHAIAGVLSGLPMIAAPIVAGLMIDHDSLQVATIGVAALVSVPAALAHMVTFAWLSRHAPWWLCLLGAAGAFAAVGWLVTGLPWQSPWPQALGFASPAIALAIMPRAPALRGGVDVPRSEILMRIVFAVLIGAIVLAGADRYSARINGLLLAWPVTGSILPCFTLALHGRQATVNLLRGFANGLFGYVTFFLVLSVSLEHSLDKVPAFAFAVAAAVAAAWLVHRIRRLGRPNGPSDILPDH